MVVKKIEKICFSTFGDFFGILKKKSLQKWQKFLKKKRNSKWNWCPQIVFGRSKFNQKQFTILCCYQNFFCVLNSKIDDFIQKTTSPKKGLLGGGRGEGSGENCPLNKVCYGLHMLQDLKFFWLNFLGCSRACNAGQNYNLWF